MNINDKKEIKEHHNFQEVIDECIEKAYGGNYIFRGTSCSRKRESDIIQSSLYRLLDENDLISPNFDLVEIEKDKVRRARYLFAPNTSDIQILTELRHYADDLTIIDFTRNLYVALFFACGNTLESQDEKINKDDGEVIMMKMPETKLYIDYNATNHYAIEPAAENASYNRVLAQDSIFIHAKNGFIDPNPNDQKNKVIAVKVKRKLKVEILEYLRKFYNIERKSMFKDVVGFIDSEKRSNPFDYYRGMIAFKEKDHDKALALFDEIIKNNPQSFGAFNSRGAILSIQKKFDESIADYSRAIKLNPDYDLAYANRAIVWKEKGEIDEALVDFNKALEINPEDKKAFLERGKIYISKLKFIEALEDLNCALALDPKFRDSLHLRVKVNLALNRNIDAQKDFENYISIYPKQIETYLLKAYYTYRNDEKKGLEKYNNVIDIDPENIQAYLELGVFQLSSKNFDDAINYFSTAINLLKSSTENRPQKLSFVFHHRGLAKIGTYKCMGSVADFSEALELCPSNADIYNHRGSAYLALGEIEKNQKNTKEAMRYYSLALAELKKSIGINPDLAYAYHNLAIVHNELGNSKESKQYSDIFNQLNKVMLDKFNFYSDAEC